MVSEVVLDWTCSPTGHGFEVNSPEPTELEGLGLHIIKVQSCGEMSPSLMRTEITQMTVNKCVKEAGSYCGHWARSCQGSLSPPHWGDGELSLGSCEDQTFEAVLNKLPVTLHMFGFPKQRLSQGPTALDNVTKTSLFHPTAVTFARSGAVGTADLVVHQCRPWQDLRIGGSHASPCPSRSFPPTLTCMVWAPLGAPRTDCLTLLHIPSKDCPKMSLEWLVAWSWSLDGLRDCIATGIQSVRDCDTTAVITVACLLVLFVWYCYHVGREQPRPYVSVNSLMQAADANGLQNGYVYCQSPECMRCTHNEGLNQKLYHNLQEYAKRYSWSGMGRIHKGIREQGRYLNSRPSIQKPEVFFLPDLPTTPYFSRDAQKHDVEVLERNFQTILCEFETLYKAFSNCSLPQGWKMNSTPSGEWFTFYLVNQGVCVPRNCRKCPRTYRLLGSLRTCIGNNVFGNACISVLSPGTVITEHYGPTNIRIRCHLGLKTPNGCELVVGGEPQCWAEGRCLLFDDSFLHAAFHEGSAEDGPRVVFMVDLWHPNVAAAERQALDFIFAPGR
nr:aspartate beta-hydroxylase domain-containing protein 2 isoform X1 [Macaca fascicularis]